MTKKITIVGLDPSMNNFGMVRVTMDLDTGILDTPDLFLSESLDQSDSKNVRQNSKDLNTAKKHYKALKEFLVGADLVIAEIPVGSQSSRAMASYGMCIGLLASIEASLIQVTPSEVKIAATNSKTATKAEMIDWAFNKFPNAQWTTVKRTGSIVLTAKNEHLADALAAIYAGLNTSEFKLAKAILSK
jgi:hypothetical protein